MFLEHNIVDLHRNKKDQCHEAEWYPGSSMDDQVVAEQAHLVEVATNENYLCMLKVQCM